MRRQLMLSLILAVILTSCSQSLGPPAANVQTAQPIDSKLPITTIQPNQMEVLTEATAPASHAPFRVTTYQGQPLPSPSGGGLQGPPPAWLVVGDRIIPATYGSATQREVPPPELMDEVATVNLPADTAPIIIIGAGPIEEFNVGIRPWGDYTALYKMLSATQSPDQPTVFTLEPIGAVDDQLLGVYVFFGYTEGKGGDATYIWRLNPPSN